MVREVAQHSAEQAFSIAAEQGGDDQMVEQTAQRVIQLLTGSGQVTGEEEQQPF